MGYGPTHQVFLGSVCWDSILPFLYLGKPYSCLKIEGFLLQGASLSHHMPCNVHYNCCFCYEEVDLMNNDIRTPLA